MPSDIRHIVGVDFSAAKNDAGRNTWIADCRVRGEDLMVCSLENASKHLRLDPKKRDIVHQALVEHIADLENTIVAMDFPFSLPQWVIERDDWESFVQGTPCKWGVLDEISDPKSLYEAVKQHTNETNCCTRRKTDTDHSGQDPAGYRIKTQTYYGIANVLGPLSSKKDVAVRPFQSVRDAQTLVAETYPAAVFERIGAERRGYKSDDCSGISARRKNLRRLEVSGMSVDSTYRDFAIGTDNALDALAAAYGAWVERKEIRSGSVESPVVEGTIYAGRA